jgi:hypothetical protein
MNVRINQLRGNYTDAGFRLISDLLCLVLASLAIALNAGAVEMLLYQPFADLSGSLR